MHVVNGIKLNTNQSKFTPNLISGILQREEAERILRDASKTKSEYRQCIRPKGNAVQASQRLSFERFWQAHGNTLGSYRRCDHLPALASSRSLEERVRRASIKRFEEKSRRRSPCVKLEKNKLLLRRPMVETALPLLTTDDLFQSLAKYNDLTPLNFDTNHESVMFYSTHYPLLLHKLFEEEKEKVVVNNRRSVTPDAHTAHNRRTMTMQQRLMDMDIAMEDIEQDADGEYYTELHHVTFNPTKWPWNKHRYQ